MSLPAAIIGEVADSTTNPSLGFGSWRTPDTDNAVIVAINFKLVGTGTSSADITVDVDESGGTTADYTMNFTAPAGLGGAAFNQAFFMVPAGGAYKITNINDPNSENAIDAHREYVA